MEKLTTFFIFCLAIQSICAALTKDQLLSVLSGAVPSMFDPMPKFEPQNAVIVLDEPFDIQLQPGSGLSTASQIDGPRDISTNQIIQNRDPIVVSRHDIEMPKPVAIPPTRTRWNRKSVLPKPKRAGKPNRRRSQVREPVKRDLVQQGNRVHTSNKNVITDNTLQTVGDSGISLNHGPELPRKTQRNRSPPGLSFLMLEEEHNRRCPFKINFSNLSGIFMTRDEFDLLFFLPALEANFMDGVCLTEGMKLYLDWLSYLRDKTLIV